MLVTHGAEELVTQLVTHLGTSHNERNLIQYLIILRLIYILCTETIIISILVYFLIIQYVKTCVFIQNCKIFKFYIKKSIIRLYNNCNVLLLLGKVDMSLITGVLILFHFTINIRSNCEGFS